MTSDSVEYTLVDTTAPSPSTDPSVNSPERVAAVKTAVRDMLMEHYLSRMERAAGRLHAQYAKRKAKNRAKNKIAKASRKRNRG